MMKKEAECAEMEGRGREKMKRIAKEAGGRHHSEKTKVQQARRKDGKANEYSEQAEEVNASPFATDAVLRFTCAVLLWVAPETRWQREQPR